MPDQIDVNFNQAIGQLRTSGLLKGEVVHDKELGMFLVDQRQKHKFAPNSFSWEQKTALAKALKNILGEEL
jgi:hypothetical protein